MKNNTPFLIASINKAKDMINLLISKGVYKSSVENAENLKENSSSLFLKAGKSMNESDRNRDFIVGNDNNGKDLIERGPFSIIADPTYDMTFQAMFLDYPNGEIKMQSLLNSLLYPKCNLNNSSDKMIRKVKFVRIYTEKIIQEPDGKKDVGEMEGHRYDIVFKCHIGTEDQNDSIEFVISYFDIEMQRKQLPMREKEYLQYLKGLNKKHPVKGLAFIKNPIGNKNISKEIAITAVVKDGKGGIKLDDREEDIEKINFNVMISLPSAVEAIQKGESIKIKEECEEIGDNGKEWLKFLGVSYWASEMVDKEQREYYYVPNDISCKEVNSSIEFVKKEKMNDPLYQKQLKEFFYREVMMQIIEEQAREEGWKEGIEEGREEGRKEGIEEGREEGREKGRKEGIEEGQKELLLTLLARKFYENDDLDEISVFEAQRGGFRFSEEEAKQAIKLVNEADKEKEFVDALKKEDLIQQS